MIVFDRFRAPRSIEASESVDLASKKRRSISFRKHRARQQKVVRAPKIAMRRFLNANANIEQTLVFFRSFLTTSFDRGIEIGGIDVENSMWSAEEKSTARQQNFVRQTLRKRYDFFDRFRSFSSTAIDRGIGIGRFGVEKTTFDFCREMYGAPAKNCSGPENRDASILVCKFNANANEFSSVFEHLGRSRRPHRWNRRRKIDFRFCSKINANPKKNVRAPKIAMCRFQ